MMHEIKGNLLDSDCQFICHQVNCQGKMGSGIAKSIREKWPFVYKNYVEKCEGTFMSGLYPRQMLGDIQICALYNDYYKADKHQHVVNLFSQETYGYDGKRYTSYDAFWSCLEKIKQVATKGGSIGFPKNIGCCRGGANWSVIKTMIEEVLAKDYEVYIYEYNGG